jgi:hypothetical protein
MGVLKNETGASISVELLLVVACVVSIGIVISGKLTGVLQGFHGHVKDNITDITGSGY